MFLADGPMMRTFGLQERQLPARAVTLPLSPRPRCPWRTCGGSGRPCSPRAGGRWRPCTGRASRTPCGSCAERAASSSKRPARSAARASPPLGRRFLAERCANSVGFRSRLPLSLMFQFPPNRPGLSRERFKRPGFLGGLRLLSEGSSPRVAHTMAHAGCVRAGALPTQCPQPASPQRTFCKRCS